MFILMYAPDNTTFSVIEVQQIPHIGEGIFNNDWNDEKLYRVYDVIINPPRSALKDITHKEDVYKNIAAIIYAK